MTPGLWILTDHLCRECLGRILQRMDGTAAGSYQCANCGAGASQEVEQICACGLHMRDQRDARFRCIRNPRRTPEFPAQIVVKRIAAGEDERIIQQALPLRDYL